jgi:hypothetical protein
VLLQNVSGHTSARYARVLALHIGEEYNDPWHEKAMFWCDLFFIDGTMHGERGLREAGELLFEALHIWSHNGIVLLGKHFVSPGQVYFHIGEAVRED